MEDKELFIEYHELKKEYQRSKFDYDKALNKKAEYLYSILPGGSNTESELIKGGSSDKLLNYTIKMEEIEKEITVRRNLMDNLSNRLKLKELELKDSEHILDKIYYLKYVKNNKVRHIARILNYSSSRTYDYLLEVKKTIENTKSEKIGI